jgi:hypothetical protein
VLFHSCHFVDTGHTCKNRLFPLRDNHIPYHLIHLCTTLLCIMEFLPSLEMNSFSLQWQNRSSLVKSIPLQHVESVIVYFMRLFCDNGPILSWLKNGASFCLACVLMCVCVCNSQNLYSFTNFMHTYYIGVSHMEFYQMKRLKSYTKR